LRAWSLIRPEPAYRRDAFLAGLAAAGYAVTDGAPTFPVKHGDVLVIWNRYFDREVLADRFEAAGGTVLVAENGYVRGRHDGGEYYAVAVHGHNGAGRWHVGGPERWQALGVELKPWREPGDGHVLVAPNRPFGQRGFAMPAGWGERTADELRRVTRRQVRLRMHPGNSRPAVPLADDLRGAHCAVIWSSSVGVRALIEGIPVICAAPAWICKGAAHQDWQEARLAHVDMDERRARALHALAWAQWSVDEIASGEPFRRLLLSA
jgi:hypothetical protein